MPSTKEERRISALDYADDVERMRTCLQSTGLFWEDTDIVAAWEAYSATLAAGWLMVTASDDMLLAILLKHVPAKSHWRVQPQDAGDGTGDQMLPLPDDLLAQLGWGEGDVLSVTSDKQGELVLRLVRKGQH